MEINDLVAHARSRFDHAAARRVLKEKYQARMIFPHSGGLWRAGPELQTTLMTCPEPDAVILDLYETPVRVNTRELYAASQQRWQEQMNAWLAEFEQMSQNR